LFGLASSLALIIRKKTFPPSADFGSPWLPKDFFTRFGNFFTIPERKLQPFFPWNNGIFMLNSRAVSPNYLNTLPNPDLVVPVIMIKSGPERKYTAYHY
jgi:hypothetical protein